MSLEAIDLFKDALRYNRLMLYRPYGHPDTLCPDGPIWKAKHESGEWDEWSNKPWQWDFHAKGVHFQERMLCCANRPGKSFSGGAEVAMHLTGRYPDWWVGRRFEKPVEVWCGSPTNETSKAIVQKELLGAPEIGTGWIPKEDIIGKPTKRQCGVSDVVDTIKVKHYTNGRYDGDSICELKSFEQGWRKFQGTAKDVVWLDEEPEDWTIYTECLTRLLTKNGIMMVTFTPLLGQTELVQHFQDTSKNLYMGMASWSDAPHLKKVERDQLAQSYKKHERQARMFGTPMMGEGAIFDEPEERVCVLPFAIPQHWPRLCGLDFGIYHAAADVGIAWDRDRDVIYVTSSNKVEDVDAIHHASAMKKRFGRTPCAWPHDGLNRGKSDGVRLADIYRDNGVNMLGRSARYKNDTGGAQPVWPIIEEIRQREATDRIKYFEPFCKPLLNERRNYHQKDGKPVDRLDDCLKAMFYAVMMRRYGIVSMARRPTAGGSILK